MRQTKILSLEIPRFGLGFLRHVSLEPGDGDGGEGAGGGGGVSPVLGRNRESIIQTVLT